jgi:omega-6 fatty acid desaturase (delta-12 desaturase)
MRPAGPAATGHQRGKRVATISTAAEASARPRGLAAARKPVDARKAQVQSFASHCAAFRQPSTSAALLQIATTLIPLVVLFAAMLWLADKAYWATLLLAIPVGGILVRCFIIQHDCGHGSFLPNPRINHLLGCAMSVLTVTPYGLWRREHAIHHAGSGHLDRRGIGDIDTWTVEEYLSRTPAQRLWYRIYRHPAFLFGVGVPFYFMMLQRIPWFHGLKFSEAWKSVTGLNVALIATYGTLGWFTGYWTLACVLLPIVFVASAIGGWLFFIQHQFEETYWEPAENWDFQVAAFHGSTYYVLPKVLQWFTGNIGLHHIHHLNSMIPNYRLQECMDALPALSQINRLTLRESLACVRLTLWDPVQRRLIGFSELPRPATG